MKLTYSQEQAMLRESVERVLAETYPFERRRAIASATGLDEEVWRSFAELGWLALPFAEEDGGLGAGPVEIAIVAEAMGRAAVVEPWIETVVLAGGLLAALGTPQQKSVLLTGLIEGTARPALAHCERAAGADLRQVATSATRHGETYRISGEKVLVPAAGAAETLLVSARLENGDVSLFIVPANAVGVTIETAATVDGARAGDVTLENVAVSADALLGTGDALPAILAAHDRAAAASCADAVGAMRALLDATISHTKERQQFGKPLAAFQALQHRIAEMAVKCEEAHASALLAALSVDAGEDLRIRGVSGAKARIGKISRHVAHEAIQLHGAMGFSDEMPVGTWFRRLYAFENRYGTTAHHLARYCTVARDPEIAANGLLRADGTGGTDAMNLSMDADDIAFRDEVRAFLDAELTDDLKRAERLNPSFLAHPPTGLEWQAKLAAKGWAAPSWPKEHGGPGWSLTRRYIFDQECERAGEPHFRSASIKMIAPVLMRYGDGRQKSVYLPRILSGEDLWAQGYSEPGAGSDLASLKTKAVRDGDHYIVNGSKIWSTHAHHATRMFALVRTDDTGRKQEGITFLLLDMKAPGVTVRPIVSICGTHEFNQVFFDDLRVPVADRVGEEGEGWEIAKYLLEFERGGSFAGGMLRAAYAKLLRMASTRQADGTRAIDDPLFAARFAEIGTDVDANDMLELTAMSQVQAGGNPGSVPSSTMKIERSRIRQSIAELAASILGPDALRWEEHRPMHELAPLPQVEEERKVASAAYFNSRSQSIFGGSNEIQLEIIARTLLR